MKFRVVILLWVLISISAFGNHIEATGTSIFTPDSPAAVDITLFWAGNYWDVSAYTSPCLDTEAGCHLGSVEFTPPTLNLPPGATNLSGIWDFRFAFNISDLPDGSFHALTFATHYPPGHPWGDFYQTSYPDPPGSGVFQGLMDIDNSTKQFLQPITVDVYFGGTTSPGQLFGAVYGDETYGDTRRFNVTHALTGEAVLNKVTLDYDVADTPEPRSAWLVAVGAVIAGFGVRRKRR